MYLFYFFSNIHILIVFLLFSFRMNRNEILCQMDPRWARFAYSHEIQTKWGQVKIHFWEFREMKAREIRLRLLMSTDDLTDGGMACLRAATPIKEEAKNLFGRELREILTMARRFHQQNGDGHGYGNHPHMMGRPVPNMASWRDSIISMLSNSLGQIWY